jgi:penicillin-binding protein 1C
MMCFTLVLLTASYLWQTTPLPTATQLRTQAARGDTRIVDRHGRLIASMPDPLGQSRQPIALRDIPLTLRQATIAVEDASFYQNAGIDLRGIGRALWQNAQNGEIVAGGSTITQQLARNTLLDPTIGKQQTLERKLREIVLALKLTSSYSKDEILELYLNQTYYGGMAFGVEAAAWRIFGKPARELNLAEATLISGLPQAPSRYDPLSDGGVAAKQRQLQVLDAMQRAGYLDTTQAELAAIEPLRLSDGTCRPGTCDYLAPHFVDFVLNQLFIRYRAEEIVRGGLTITTTLDLGLQQASQAILKRQLQLLNNPRDGSPNRQAHNGAIIVLDPHDGAILAMVGSPNFADRANQGQVNATTALRQPGSALKPLTYAAALEQGYTPASILLDIPTSFRTSSGQPYTPQNYDRRFHGPLSLREALATSSNVAAVRTLQAIGIPALLDITKRMGIRSLEGAPSQYGLALTLGGGEVTLLELTGAYAGFANLGIAVQPYAIIEVASLVPGAALREPPPVPASIAITPQIAYLITDILADPYARLRAFGSQLDIGRPAAVKTGTSTDWRDNWTIGYTPDRVVGVWVGNADGSPMQAVSGVSGAGPVWRAVMREAHRGLPGRPFVRPAGISEITICAESGLLPGKNCPTTRQELFLSGSEPHQADDSYVTVLVDQAGTCRALGDFPRNQATLRTYRVLPAEAQIWAIEAGIPQIPRKPCTLTHSANSVDTLFPANQATYQPIIRYPADGAFFTISAGIAKQHQQLEIQAQANNTTEQLIISINGTPLGTFTAPPYRLFWQLIPGHHTISVEAIDTTGQRVAGENVVIVVQ